MAILHFGECVNQSVWRELERNYNVDGGRCLLYIKVEDVAYQKPYPTTYKDSTITQFTCANRVYLWLTRSFLICWPKCHNLERIFQEILRSEQCTMITARVLIWWCAPLRRYLHHEDALLSTSSDIFVRSTVTVSTINWSAAPHSARKGNLMRFWVGFHAKIIVVRSLPPTIRSFLSTILSFPLSQSMLGISFIHLQCFHYAMRMSQSVLGSAIAKVCSW